jgi:uncharacterized membrane protein YfcA
MTVKVGMVCSFAGIRGTLSAPFLIWCNISGHEAIGTSVAIGFPIAVAETVSYAYNGLYVPILPEYSLGCRYCGR